MEVPRRLIDLECTAFLNLAMVTSHPAMNEDGFKSVSMSTYKYDNDTHSVSI